jgi:lysophospholipase L1-like esterase
MENSREKAGGKLQPREGMHTKLHGPKAMGILTLMLSLAFSGALVVAADYLWGLNGGLAEVRIAARQFRSETAPYALHTSALIPNVHHEYRDRNGNSPRLLRTNSDGLIIGPTERSDEGAVRILFLGGSTTETNEVAEDKRFPFVVQENLQRTGINAVTLNAGVRGHTTQDSLVAYLSRSGFRAANYVVLMHNINDRLWLAHFDGYASPVSRAGQTTWGAVELYLSGAARALWDFASYQSNLLFSLRQRLTFFNPWTGEPLLTGAVTERNLDHTGDRALQRLEKFDSNLHAFIALTRSQGSVPILMTQPLGNHSAAQQLFNDSIRRIAALENTLLIDLEDALGPEPHWAFLGDGIHYNDEGSEFIGKVIAQVLGRTLGD